MTTETPTTDQAQTYKKTEYFTCLVCESQYPTESQARACAQTPIPVSVGDLFIIEREFREPFRKVREIVPEAVNGRPTGLCKLRVTSDKIGPTAKPGDSEQKVFTRDARNGRECGTGFPAYLPASENLLKARIKDVKDRLASSQDAVQKYQHEINAWAEILDFVKAAK